MKQVFIDPTTSVTLVITVQFECVPSSVCSVNRIDTRANSDSGLDCFSFCAEEVILQQYILSNIYQIEIRYIHL